MGGKREIPAAEPGRADSVNYAGIDIFRMAAAFMVIAIHTAPFLGWGEEADVLLTYCLGRVAVPFFFMTTGYFVLAAYVRSGFRRKRNFYRYLAKNAALYMAATVLYLPLMAYSGKLPESIPGFLKVLFFDGTFYHLWYFPAAILGCVWIALLMQVSVRAAVGCSVAAYVIGVFGDSYYGVAEQIPLLKAGYSGLFRISSYTRNGIFFAPVFLLLGMLLRLSRRLLSRKLCVWGMVLSSVLMAAEGFLTYSLGWQRHNSMYFFLLPVMFFLFQLLLMVQGRAPAFFRKGSLILYVIHPAVIVVLRGIAKRFRITDLLVDCTFIQYLTVSGVSLLAAWGVYELEKLKRQGKLWEQFRGI